LLLIIFIETSKDNIKDKVVNMGKKLGQSLFQSEEKPKIEPLTSNEIFKLDYKAAQFLANSNKPLETFVQLLQDFPKYAKSISQVDINPKFEEELVENQASFLRAGMNAVWLNGKGLEYSQLDPF
jgi:UDP-glucose:glycoprotein glucosyltransferase